MISGVAVSNDKDLRDQDVGVFICVVDLMLCPGLWDAEVRQLLYPHPQVLVP